MVEIGLAISISQSKLGQPPKLDEASSRIQRYKAEERIRNIKKIVCETKKQFRANNYAMIV